MHSKSADALVHAVQPCELLISRPAFSAPSKTRPEERKSAKRQPHKQQQGVREHHAEPLRWDARAPNGSMVSMFLNRTRRGRAR